MEHLKQLVKQRPRLLGTSETLVLRKSFDAHRWQEFPAAAKVTNNVPLASDFDQLILTAYPALPLAIAPPPAAGQAGKARSDSRHQRGSRRSA